MAGTEGFQRASKIMISYKIKCPAVISRMLNQNLLHNYIFPKNFVNYMYIFDACKIIINEHRCLFAYTHFQGSGSADICRLVKSTLFITTVLWPGATHFPIYNNTPTYIHSNVKNLLFIYVFLLQHTNTLLFVQLNNIKTF